METRSHSRDGAAHKRRHPFLALALVALCLSGCASAPKITTQVDASKAAPGEIRSVESITNHSALHLRLINWRIGVPKELSAERGIKMFRVEYWTTDPQGGRAFASGLVAIPNGTDPVRGVVSYQHGTTSQKKDVPSAGGINEGLFAAAIFAGHGYILAAPDYLGLGTSPGMHPYIHADTEGRAVIDLLKAARTLAGASGLRWPGGVFLTGFSQGGHATIAAHEILDREPQPGLQVLGCAPIAGAFNISAIAFPYALGGGSESHSLYLGYVLTAYAGIYKGDLSSVVRKEFVDSLPDLFDGLHEEEKIEHTLPKNPRELFRDDFLHAYETGGSSWFIDSMRKNDIRWWKPAAPIHFFYGDKDKDVNPKESMEAAKLVKEKGGDAQSFSAGEKDHTGSVFPSMAQIRPWFDELAAKGPK